MVLRDLDEPRTRATPAGRGRRAVMMWLVASALLGAIAGLADGAPGDRTLRLVTTNGADTAAAFQGATADGSRVWFQTAEAIPGSGDTDAAYDVYERASDGTLRLISTDGGDSDAFFAGASADGSRVWFQTAEAIPGSGDTDAAYDVYERASDGTLRLVSTDGGDNDAFFAGATEDGSRVWFFTDEALLAVDTDTAADVYERSDDGTLRLVTTGGADIDAVFQGATPSGSLIWFLTTEALLAGDTDTAADVYERSGDGTLRLVSTGGADTDVLFRDASTDGSRVWFLTAEPLLAEDTDAALDVYERASDGALRLISTGGADIDAFFRRATADGSRVWFETAEALLPDDTDSTRDTYERASDGTLRLVTTGGADVDAFLTGATADGSRVWFLTAEALLAEDTDAALDVYERASDGALRLISTGGADSDAFFQRATADGSRVWFETDEAIPGTGDTDTALDLYERAWGLPESTILPTVSGEPRTGADLTCSPGAWAGEGIALAVQWLRDGAPIAGARDPTYRVGADDAGRDIACRVSATNAIGGASAESAARAIAAAPTGARAIAAPPVCASVPAAPPSRSSGRVTLTVAQLRINQNIYSAGIRRARAIDRWLAAGIVSGDLCAGGLTAAPFGAGVSIAPGPGGPITGPAPTPRPITQPPPRAKPGVVFTLSVAQLQINQRIASALVRRANALRTRLNTGLTGGDVRDGQITTAKLSPTITIAAASPAANPPGPSRTSVARPAGKRGITFRVSTAQLRINQRIGSAAIRRLNDVRDRLLTGLAADDFRDGSISAVDLAPDLVP